jgi:hypothetical protein
VAYLDDNPPRRSQGGPRRGVVSGGVVVHTAESGLPDISPPDSRAEGVASFIRGRSDPGCYHVLFDSDSTIEMWDFVPMTAYHDGTGTNDFSTGMSFATNAAAWGQYPAWDEKALRRAADWLAKRFIPTMKARGVTVRLERTSVSKFRNGDPAFVAHGDLDPGRRTDPGAGFPWQRLFDYTKQVGGGGPNDEEEEDMFLGFYKREGQPAIYSVYSGGYKTWIKDEAQLKIMMALAKMQKKPYTIKGIGSDAMFRALGPVMGPKPRGTNEWGLK